MCRLLAIKSKDEFDPVPYMESFAEMCRNSKEYQGHGWGCSFILNNEWHTYKNINPIWEADYSHIPHTNLLLVHARSAFRDEGIIVENNMPFYDDKYHFIFNGELQGVRIKESGRIGAEKVFNFIKRFDKGDFVNAITRGVKVIDKKTNYARAMNFIISDGVRLYVNSFYNKDADYFTLQTHTGSEKIICSEPLSIINNWTKIENKVLKVY